jgi:hypothetical protein
MQMPTPTESRVARWGNGYRRRISDDAFPIKGKQKDSVPICSIYDKGHAVPVSPLGTVRTWGGEIGIMSPHLVPHLATPDIPRRVVPLDDSTDAARRGSCATIRCVNLGPRHDNRIGSREGPCRWTRPATRNVQGIGMLHDVVPTPPGTSQVCSSFSDRSARGVHKASVLNRTIGASLRVEAFLRRALTVIISTACTIPSECASRILG